MTSYILLVCGQRVCSRFYNFVAVFVNDLKNWENHRNDGIRRLLLLEQIPTFGELDDKETGPHH